MSGAAKSGNLFLGGLRRLISIGASGEPILGLQQRSASGVIALRMGFISFEGGGPASSSCRLRPLEFTSPLFENAVGVE